MKIAKVLGAVALVIIALIVVTMVRFGWFTKIEIMDETVPSMTLVAAYHQGEYAAVGPVMADLYNSATEAGIVSEVGVGVYYDNPDSVVVDSLRALVGMTIEDSVSSLVDSLSGDYRVVEVPEMNAKVVHFPYKGQLSILFAVMKVYPALQKEFGDAVSDSPIFEIYDIPNREIRFVIPQDIPGEVFESWLKDEVVVEDTMVIIDDTISTVEDSVTNEDIFINELDSITVD